MAQKPPKRQTLRDEQAATNEAVRVAEEMWQRGSLEPRDSDLVTLSNGIVIRIKPVPPLLLMYAGAGLQRPKPPVYFDEKKGREVENPADPDYIEAREAFDRRSNRMAMDVLMLTGTAIEHLPLGVPDPQDDEDTGWIEVLEEIGMGVDRRSVPSRYMWWLRTIALTDLEDLNTLSAAVGRRVGVREEDVQRAAESFRGDKVRRTDSGGAAARDGTDGD